MMPGVELSQVTCYSHIFMAQVAKFDVGLTRVLEQSNTSSVTYVQRQLEQSHCSYQCWSNWTAEAGKVLPT